MKPSNTLPRRSREVAVDFPAMKNTNAVHLIPVNVQSQPPITDADAVEPGVSLEMFELWDFGRRTGAFQRLDDLLHAAQETRVTYRFQVSREGGSESDGHGRLPRSRANTSVRLAGGVLRPSRMARLRPMSSSASRSKAGRSWRISSKADLTWRLSGPGRPTVAIMPAAYTLSTGSGKSVRLSIRCGSRCVNRSDCKLIVTPATRGWKPLELGEIVARWNELKPPSIANERNK